MSAVVFLREIPLSTTLLKLYKIDDFPVIEWEEQFFAHIWLLVQKCPLLSDPHYLKEFAEASNFLWKGETFEYISSIPDYQSFYHTQIALERECSGDIFPYRLTDYQIFDVSCMHDPLLSEGWLTYFVYQVETGLPYRVVCPFPYDGNATCVHYQILPICN